MDFDIVERTLKDAFSSKGRDVEDRNVACARKGFEIGRDSPVKSPPLSAHKGASRYLSGRERKPIALALCMPGAGFIPDIQ